MFHDGQYLEVIKASDNCLATAIVTVKSKMVKIDKEKVSSNKWLSFEDWYELYKILQKAILRNSKASKGKDKFAALEMRKSTKRLDIVYAIEPPENIKHKNALSTIKVRVSPLKRTSRTSQSSAINKKTSVVNTKTIVISSTKLYDNTSVRKAQRLTGKVDTYNPEEYVPTDLVNKQRTQEHLKYVPSRKSLLKQMKECKETNSNEYSPTLNNQHSFNDKRKVDYVPNPISSLEKVSHEVYDPCGMSILPPELSEAYIPSAKGSNAVVEEYQPGFATKTMKFDNSYVPSLRRPADQTKSKIVKKKIRSESEIKLKKKLFLNNNKKQVKSKDTKREL